MEQSGERPTKSTTALTQNPERRTGIQPQGAIALSGGSAKPIAPEGEVNDWHNKAIAYAAARWRAGVAGVRGMEQRSLHVRTALSHVRHGDIASLNVTTELVSTANVTGAPRTRDSRTFCLRCGRKIKNLRSRDKFVTAQKFRENGARSLETLTPRRINVL